MCQRVVVTVRCWTLPDIASSSSATHSTPSSCSVRLDNPWRPRVRLVLVTGKPPSSKMDFNSQQGVGHLRILRPDRITSRQLRTFSSTRIPGCYARV